MTESPASTTCYTPPGSAGAKSGAEKTTLTVEVCMKPSSKAPEAEVKTHVERLLQATTQWYTITGSVEVTEQRSPFLFQHVEHISICNNGQPTRNLFFWQVQPDIILYTLYSDGAAEDDEVEDGVPTFSEWELPNREFHSMWDTLVYDTDIQQRLVSHASTSLLFSQRGVNPHLVAWNKVVLLHGPPGTGKTSLCKALVQKLSIRLNKWYKMGHLIEVNAHSLFSKWFSESGKLVTKLFTKIMDFVEEADELVFVLIDEVESLTSARRAAVGGNEPSDAIRAVNSLLTHLDALKAHPNVMVLCTSNLPDAVDAAFVDRADIKAYIGPPGVSARYEILRSCVAELRRTAIVAAPDPLPLPWSTLEAYASGGGGLPGGPDAGDAAIAAALPNSRLLRLAAMECKGMSGRTLRKLPFLAHTNMACTVGSTCEQFINSLVWVAKQEASDRAKLVAG